jgi:hypothetical protein
MAVIGIELTCVRNLCQLSTLERIHLTAVVEREGSGYVSLCPEFDVASQGDTVEAAWR